MGYLYAIRAAFFQMFKMLIAPSYMLEPVLSAIVPSALLAWIASRSQNPSTLLHISIGVFLMMMLRWGIFRIGWFLANDFAEGTLDFDFVSRTPIAVITFGKGLGGVAACLPSGIVAFFTALVIFHGKVEAANLPMVVISFCFALVTIIAVALVFAPLMLMVRGRPGFFNAISPFGMVLSGFLYPVTLLPPVLQAIAWFLPTTWAVDGILRSIEGSGTAWRIAGDWVVAVILSIGYLALTYFLLKRVEKRIRIEGTLAAF